MIRKILVVTQGYSEVGFLTGLRDRLNCRAEIVSCSRLPLLRQRGSYTRRQDAELIAREFRAQGADLLVRLTDGDTTRPAEVARAEQEKWPENVRAEMICGVCDRDVEHWLVLDRQHAAEALGLDRLPSDRVDLSGVVKGRLSDKRAGGRTLEQVVADFVRNLPGEVFRRWLNNPAFSEFYDQCRAAARRHDCETPNERTHD